jgi:hypothetical protein
VVNTGAQQQQRRPDAMSKCLQTKAGHMTKARLEGRRQEEKQSHCEGNACQDAKSLCLFYKVLHFLEFSMSFPDTHFFLVLITSPSFLLKNYSFFFIK